MHKGLLLTTLLLMAFVFKTFAQLEVRENTTVSAQMGREISTGINIRNLNTMPAQLIIRRVESIIGSTQKSWFCINGECFPPTVEATPVSIRLDAGETFSGFQTVLSTGLSEGFSRVKYLVFDRNNPSVEYEFTINYTIENTIVQEALFSSPKMVLTDVYPNPVKDFATFQYRVIDHEAEAKIVIHSVLGSIMGEFPLQNMDTNLKVRTEGFNPGVYFYTLYINDEGVMTRKLIVQK